MTSRVTVPALLALCCSLAIGCGTETDPPPSLEIPSLYSVYGLPGPWWRNGAQRSDFEGDANACRARSGAARRAGADDAADAAYRAFLDCMQERDWARGAPPRS